MPDEFEHGGLDFAELKALGPGAVDFSSNVNPWGCSPRVIQALRGVRPSLYPDPLCRELRAVIARHEGVLPENILCGNGSSELIWAICRWVSATKSPTQATLCYPEPTFGEYATAARATGLKINHYGESITDTAGWMVEPFTRFLRQAHNDIVFLCTPNNPTGQTASRSQIEGIFRACREGVLVLDQAYREYADDGGSCTLETASRLLRLCCFTKAYGLAGLRLGYLVGPLELLVGIRAQLPSWSVSSAAQAAGIAAILDQDWLHTTVARRRASSEELRSKLTSASFDVAGSGAGFLLVHVGSASEWRSRLLLRGFAVRGCASFGLPGHRRISPSKSSAGARLVAAMKAVREEICQVER